MIGPVEAALVLLGGLLGWLFWILFDFLRRA